MKSALTRRSFVQSSALVAAAFSLPNPAFADPSHAAGKPSPVNLGLTSYTFRNFTREQMIGFMKQLNVTALNPKDVKDHLPMDPAAEAKALADYATAGITLHAGDPAPSTLPRLEKFVKKYDIRIAIHNHGPEDKVFPSPLDVLKAVKNMDPRMGCCIDIGHAVRAGTDIVEAIHEVGPRLFNTHVKDLTDFHDKESQVAVGKGIMPLREIFEALIKTNYKGFVDLEYEIHGDDPMPGVIESFAYMRGVLDGMGYRA
jgi:hypothetical protein